MCLPFFRFHELLHGACWVRAIIKRQIEYTFFSRKSSIFFYFYFCPPKQPEHPDIIKTVIVSLGYATACAIISSTDACTSVPARYRAHLCYAQKSVWQTDFCLDTIMTQPKHIHNSLYVFILSGCPDCFIQIINTNNLVTKSNYVISFLSNDYSSDCTPPHWIGNPNIEPSQYT